MEKIWKIKKHEKVLRYNRRKNMILFFSLSDVQKEFFSKNMLQVKKVLDVGAATGNLSKFSEK